MNDSDPSELVTVASGLQVYHSEKSSLISVSKRWGIQKASCDSLKAFQTVSSVIADISLAC